MTNNEMLKATSGHDTDGLPIYLDLETTGLDSEQDEIIEIAILDHNENVLLDTLVKPYYKTAWPEAQAINGITPQMVKYAPHLWEIYDEIFHNINDKDVYIWNASFDHEFLDWELEYANSVNCAMQEYGQFIQRTQPQNQSQSGRYKLDTTAKQLGIKVEGNAHRAKHDVLKMIRTRKAWQTTNRTDLNANIKTEAYK